MTMKRKAAAVVSVVVLVVGVLALEVPLLLTFGLLLFLTPCTSFCLDVADDDEVPFFKILFLLFLFALLDNIRNLAVCALLAIAAS